MGGYHCYRFCVHSGNIKTSLDQQYSGSDVAPSLPILNGTHFPSSHWILQLNFLSINHLPAPADDGWNHQRLNRFSRSERSHTAYKLRFPLNGWFKSPTLISAKAERILNPPSTLLALKPDPLCVANPSLICESDDRCSELLSP